MVWNIPLVIWAHLSCLCLLPSSHAATTSSPAWQYKKKKGLGCVSSPVASAVTKDSCVVSWKPPASDGGAKIRTYYLEKREKKQTKWISVTTDEIRETVYSVKDLIEGLEYEFRVKCENLGGESEWSEVSEPVIPKSDVPIKAPHFKEELRNLNVKFQANSTQVTWYFGMRQLESNEKYEIKYEDGVATMYVKDVSKSDDGTYRCKVVNDYGEDSSYAELFVKEHPPEFTLPLYNRTAYVGENVRFGVTITVHPEPRLTWYKSGQKIKPGDDDKKYTFESDKGLYQLVINNVTEEDDAEYSIVARNKYGEDSCKAKLTVIPHPPPADATLRPMFKRLLANAECQEDLSPGLRGWQDLIYFLDTSP
uniref:Titin n=1 Tax=Zosterops lateralis melanops TaxID=1220523 RepID=A0A8D2NSW6_ZOSLA